MNEKEIKISTLLQLRGKRDSAQEMENEGIQDSRENWIRSIEWKDKDDENWSTQYDEFSVSEQTLITRIKRLKQNESTIFSSNSEFS